jgi:hypothetical protein
MILRALSGQLVGDVEIYLVFALGTGPIKIKVIIFTPYKQCRQVRLNKLASL